MTAILAGVDRAAFATALATRLRSRGIAVGLTDVGDFVRALGAAPPGSRPELYWTARITLVRRHADLAAFDAVFAAVFEDGAHGLDPHSRRAAPVGDTVVPLPAADGAEDAGGGLPWATLPPAVAGAEDSDSPLAFPQRLPSELVALADVAFEQLTPAQLAQLGQWLEATLRDWPTRRSRRTRVDKAGHRVAIRPTIARARRTGWEPVALVRDRPVRRPRRIVLLCDVSQSMQAQATAYLHLMRAFTLRADAEVFAFATSLTRLTPVLAHRSAEVAIEQATAAVTDRFGGTRIATNLQALLASRHGGAVRGAVVVIGSDGWDSDRPEALEAAMARLRRRAHRVIWINPRAGAPGFRPTVSTMAAALPYCDRLLPADTFASLAAVVRAVSSRA
ncbi:MAG TPA: VWA domain-containing protein [Mycobacteriales bacterium]|nr:VWA domain-containing protein [Mycobacteriales bacterium]